MTTLTRGNNGEVTELAGWINASESELKRLEFILRIEKVEKSLEERIVGQASLKKAMRIGMLTGKPIIIIGPPGVGKTYASNVLAQLIGGSATRVQCTWETIPSDIIGKNMYNLQTGEWTFYPGAIFGDVVLIDEANRLNEKTQSALHEAMQEGQVTVNGITYRLPAGQLIILTINPDGSAGTERLNSPLLDRCVMSEFVEMPDRDDLIKIGLRKYVRTPIVRALRDGELVHIQSQVAAMIESIDVSVGGYVADIVINTHKHRELFVTGVSPRGVEDLLHVSAANVFMRKSQVWVTNADINKAARGVLTHRLRANAETLYAARSEDRYLEEYRFVEKYVGQLVSV
jgi:MoxR-like ATPase